MPVSVSQEDSDRMAAYEADVRDILINGTSDGMPTLPVQFSTAEYEGVPDNHLFERFNMAVVLALFRLSKNGPVKFPVQMPSYLKAAMPDATTNTGCMIFVTDAIGGAVPAFSDGALWLRVTDRVAINPF